MCYNVRWCEMLGDALCQHMGHVNTHWSFWISELPDHIFSVANCILSPSCRNIFLRASSYLSRTFSSPSQTRLTEEAKRTLVLHRNNLQGITRGTRLSGTLTFTIR